MKPVAAARYVPTLLTWIALAVAGFYPIHNPDTFGHLALGRQIVELGHIPKLDTFSYFRATPQPFVNYEWLSDWLLFEVFRAGGWSGLHGLKLAVLAVLAWLLVHIAQLRAARTGAWLVPLFTLGCLPAIRFRLSLRPHLFGLTFAALFVLGISEILTQPSRRRRVIWVCGLAVAHVFWVNLHGSHLLGLTMTLLACACSWPLPERRAELALLLVLLLGASCVSPYGPTIVSGAIEHSFDARYRELINEWRPYRAALSLWYPAVLFWQLCWLALSFAVRRAKADVCRQFEALYTLLLLIMAARSMRFYAEAAALTVPVIASGLARAWPRVETLRRTQLVSATSVCALAIGIGGCLALPPKRSFGGGVSTRGRPAASAQWLAAHLPTAHILAAMADAWDLMFSLPKAKFLVDGRSTFYGPEHLKRVQRAWSHANAMRRLLDETDTDVVVLQPIVTEQQPALRALLASSDFRLVEIESLHCVFARASSDRAALLAHSTLRLLRPGYAPVWLLSTTLDPAAVRAELELLPTHPNVDGYRTWIEGMLALRPLARAEGYAGLIEPRSAAQQKAAQVALSALRQSDRALEIVQTVTAYRALAAVAACQLSEAEAAFARALSWGPAREISFGRQELALRRGQQAQVAQFIGQARAHPEAQNDPWLAALERELTRPPRCPAP